MQKEKLRCVQVKPILVELFSFTSLAQAHLILQLPYAFLGEAVEAPVELLIKWEILFSRLARD